MNNEEKEIKKIFLTLSQEEEYNKWLQTRVAFFGLKTPREMIDSGKHEEVLKTLKRLVR